MSSWSDDVTVSSNFSVVLSKYWETNVYIRIN